MKDFWLKVRKDVLLKLVSFPLSVKVQLIFLSTVFFLHGKISSDQWVTVIGVLVGARAGISVLGAWRNGGVKEFDR